VDAWASLTDGQQFDCDAIEGAAQMLEDRLDPDGTLRPIEGGGSDALGEFLGQACADGTIKPGEVLALLKEMGQHHVTVIAEK
jgi:hypothetical protein